jgi:hypothetical protein
VADVILVPDDPSYTPPGATMAPAAPTAVLSIPSGGSVAAEDDVIVHLHGGGADAHALNLAVRLASARGRPLRIGGSGANRRVNASVERLRRAGIAIADDGGGGGLHVDGGAAAPSRPEAATLWLRSGRDDGIEPLRALVDRVTRTITADGG